MSGPVMPLRPVAEGDQSCVSAKLRECNIAEAQRLWDAGEVTARRQGLRERKKQATREALREAALLLALERGPDNVRVDDIADAAGVSPRTYNNYFSSREQAIVAVIDSGRESGERLRCFGRCSRIRPVRGCTNRPTIGQFPRPYFRLLLYTRRSGPM
jgi:hypothetical protein